MKIQQIIDGILAKSGISLDPKQTCDQVMWGDTQQEARRIATTFMATVDVIRQAIDQGVNFIITHEPTWYTGHDTVGWLEGDEVYEAKKKLLEGSDLVIWRFHDHMHMGPEDGIYRGFDRKLGWAAYRLPHRGGEPEFGGCYELPATTLRGVADAFHEKLGMDVLQIVGDPEMPVSRVGVYVGGGSLGLGVEERPMQHMRENALDLIVCGDITGWTTVPYILDAQALGVKRAMLILGHERSEEMGMEFLGEWLGDIVEDTPVVFIDAREPFRYLLY